MHVLIPIDGSEPAERALDYALERFPDARLTALCVVDPTHGAASWDPTSADDYLRAQKADAEEKLEAAADYAAERDRSLATAVEVGQAARRIVRYASENDVDEIVIGSHGRDGVARILLGSVAESVVRRAPVPVTVVRPPERN